MTVELSRPLAAERVGATPIEIEVIASPAEREALAVRMGIPAVLDLRCTFALHREAGGIRADARLHARVMRVCVVSLDEFEAEVAEDFTVRFVPEGAEADEIDPEADDEVPYANATIDLGEAAAQQLALALDPYPRKPGAVLPDEPAAPSNPFAGLDALRRRH
ncbi:MAG: YceD family protein [Acetobacteraceae bacterium]